MNTTMKIITGIALLAIIILAQGVFVVNQTQQAMVLQFGRPVKQIQEAGLKLKVPFIQNVVYFEKRLLDLDPPVEQVILKQKKRLDVDSFTRFRIVDPLAYYKAVAGRGGVYSPTQAENNLKDLLGAIVNSTVREVLGRYELTDLLSEKRIGIMAEIRDKVKADGISLGIDVVDVRIKRADLPEVTSGPIYNRMRSERIREAKEVRAQGFEFAEKIRSNAERERTVLLAEAQKEAQITRGEGDKAAAKTWADAANKDKEFYAFYRSLQAYKTALSGEGTSLVLSPDSEFFRYLDDVPGVKSSRKKR
ncbi:MAG: protease modulator HflC [Alphaproteobacteria bacterium]|nr:protease modulator HflC [Alphaproteobacteria bacterium]